MELNILSIINTLVEINTEWTGAAVLEIYVNDITEKAMKLVDVICKHYFNNIGCVQLINRPQQSSALGQLPQTERTAVFKTAHCQVNFKVLTLEQALFYSESFKQSGNIPVGVLENKNVFILFILQKFHFSEQQ